MCWVMPPASPAMTLVLRMLSSSEVLPWSTWPMTVTTGGRSVMSSSLTSAPSRTSSPYSLRNSISRSYSAASSSMLSFSRRWLMVAMMPMPKSLPISSWARVPSLSASSCTVMNSVSFSTATSTAASSSLRSPLRRFLPRAPVVSSAMVCFNARSTSAWSTFFFFLVRVRVCRPSPESRAAASSWRLRMAALIESRTDSLETSVSAASRRLGRRADDVADLEAVVLLGAHVVQAVGGTGLGLGRGREPRPPAPRRRAPRPRARAGRARAWTRPGPARSRASAPAGPRPRPPARAPAPSSRCRPS